MGPEPRLGEPERGGKRPALTQAGLLLGAKGSPGLRPNEGEV